MREREHIRWFDAQPLFGKRVLVTRPAHQADDFATRLWEAGAEPILAPTIAIGPPDDPAAARDAVARVREYDWAAFTSRNGVDAFFDRLGELGRDARAFGDVRIAAIGPKTAAALAARGIRVDLVPAAFVNEAVAAELLARTAPGDRVLVYRAQEARDVLPDTLREHGRVADVVAAYETRFVDDPELARESGARRHRDVHQLQHRRRLRAQRPRRGARARAERRSRRSARSPRKPRATPGSASTWSPTSSRSTACCARSPRRAASATRIPRP